MVITFLQHIAEMPTAAKLLSPFLAYPTMPQSCICLSSSVCDVCIVAKRCVLKQKLLSTAYRKSYIRWYQNGWPWPLFSGRIKVLLTIALHTTFIISETVW